MNSCILMAKIVRAPELRYTKDNQTPIAEMLVEFAGLRADDPPATLRAVGWGNLATELQENYAVGEQVVLEGRLSMNTIERQEGFKEKRAELVVARIHRLGVDASTPVAAPTIASEPSPEAIPAPQPTPTPVTPQVTPVDPDLDDIPF